MKTQQLTALFWLLAIAYLLALLTSSGSLLIALKPLPILLLAAGAAVHLTGRWRLGMVAALLLSATGDVLLALRIDGFDSFVPGLAAFLLAQLIYAGLFWSQRSLDRRRLRFVALYVVLALLLASIVLPNTGALRLPVACYLLAISAMAIAAAMSAIRLPWLFVGALVFVSSDSLIAINKFVMPLPAASLLIMLTYYLAQWLIWHSVVSARRQAKTATIGAS